ISIEVRGLKTDKPNPPSGSPMDFFFQAEDGIRDFHVTGVQTCALPISVKKVLVASGVDIAKEFYLGMAVDRATGSPVLIASSQRSEERRVGKGYRYRGQQYLYRAQVK